MRGFTVYKCHVYMIIVDVYNLHMQAESQRASLEKEMRERVDKVKKNVRTTSVHVIA